ncbi:hypothetical protein BJF83_17725 [Nocardiopsis sp. CNR-923]|uniref:hypothetical protein n=1 Tax=Nocardiopsis sp. CNR-923 TaxID=1904965 RepID=UPI00095B5DEC|nr:hypothetical protein [Nocardiopsis sp. CNR-923]OLT27698.1 hypothetical protein BJF83_17725 [Nocardiopsis sp. CNR-923]
MRAELSRITARDELELRLAADEDDAGAGLALVRSETAGDPVPVTDVEREGRVVRARLADLALEEGTWDVVSVDRSGSAMPVLTRDSGLSLRRRVDYVRHPRTRDLRAMRDPRGRLRLVSASVTPYAEVEWVEVTPEAVTVSGFLAYAPGRDGAATGEVVARQRGLTGVETAPARLDGDRFACAIPLPPLARAFQPMRRHNEWDLWLRLPEDEPELRLASHADDVVGKKGKVVYTGVDLAGGEADTTVRIRPYYTVRDEFSLLANARNGGAA